MKCVRGPSGSPVTTTYGYDAQDDLISVVRGSQARSFGYHSLKELVWAINPEVSSSVAACNGSTGSVSVCYTYDADGNLATKVAAARASSSIQTTYTYDAKTERDRPHPRRMSRADGERDLAGVRSSPVRPLFLALRHRLDDEPLDHLGKPPVRRHDFSI